MCCTIDLFNKAKPYLDDGYCCEYEKECADVDECYQFIGDDDE